MNYESDLRPLIDDPEGLLPFVLSDLVEFVGLVGQWNKAINVVSKSSLAEVWNRHVIDSAQIFRFAPLDARKWIDLGSGGGFPGIVVAILAKHFRPDLLIVLVESDRRKAVFLREVIRKLRLAASVETDRIERLEPQVGDVISARALAPLSLLCGHIHRHLDQGGVAIIHKGQKGDDEIEVARRGWSFEIEQVESVTSATANILILKELRLV